MSNMSIGQEIVVLRAEQGWTQQQFAEKLNTSQRTVAAWEAGASVPRKTMKVKIAQVFGLPANYFLVETAPNDPTEDGRPENDWENIEMIGQGVIENIEDFVSNNYQEIDEEKKIQVLETIQGILNSIEKK